MQTYNKILTDKERSEYQSLIDDMYQTCTETMSRKIEGANVQQAFVVQTILDIDIALEIFKDIIEVLCIGSYEDTAFEYLVKKFKYNINGIDPVISLSLEDFVSRYDKQYEISFACSVIEHVDDDIKFIEDMIKTIKPLGYGIITCDFNNNYKSGDRLPTTSKRFYTEDRIINKLIPILESRQCYLVDEPAWDSQPFEFEWEGIRYDFATIVFRKSLV